VTQRNDMANNSFKNDVNEKVREILNQYHQVSQETFQKILSDKDAKSDEIINILNSRLLLAKAEREEFADKLENMNEVIENYEKKISDIKNQYEAEISDIKKLSDVERSKYRAQTEQLKCELKDAQIVQETLHKENSILGKMVEESIALAEKFFKDKMELTTRKKKS